MFVCPILVILWLPHMMIDILKSRNSDEGVDPPEDFDPSSYQPVEPTPEVGTLSQPDESKADHKYGKTKMAKPTHSPEGFLLSTSTRPGSSKFQFVTFNKQLQNLECAFLTRAF